MERTWEAKLDLSSPLVAAAIHDGHSVSDEYRELTGLTKAARLMEEDPYTGRLARLSPSHFVAGTSRFQVDLNRERHAAVYRSSAEAWGMNVWRDSPPGENLIESWLEEYDDFYRDVETALAGLLERHAVLFVLDLHSYRHRRDPISREREDPQEKSPDVNIGMSNIAEFHGAKFEPVIGAFEETMRTVVFPGRGGLDVRRDVKFKGANFGRWINSTFPGRVCSIAVEFKKIFMDEWTGKLYVGEFGELEKGMSKASRRLEAVLRDI